MANTIPFDCLSEIERVWGTIKVLGDDPLELLQIEDVPLPLRCNVVRVPTTPGFVLEDQLRLTESVVLSPADFTEVLVMRATLPRDPIYPLFDEFANMVANFSRIKITIRDVRNTADLLAAFDAASRARDLRLAGRCSAGDILRRSTMKRACLLGILLVVSSPLAVLAQAGFAGTWRAEGQPSMPWTFALSVDRSTVTGTATMPGTAVAIFDGRTDGRTVIFKAKSADGDRIVTFTGTWEGEALSFARDVQVRAGGSPGGNGLLGTLAPQRFIARRVSREVITPVFGQTDPELERRDRPVAADDLRIVAQTRALLANDGVWNRNDDRECADDEASGKRSLFCALQKATIDVLGEYDHRRVALQEVRFAIEDATRGQDFEHRLKDWNNLPATTLKDIWRALDVATERMRSRLPKQ